MRLSNGFVIDKEKTFGELKFTAFNFPSQNENSLSDTGLTAIVFCSKLFGRLIRTFIILTSL